MSKTPSKVVIKTSKTPAKPGASVKKAPQMGMQIEMCHPDTITRYPNNPRRNQGAVDAVRKSLRDYGWKQPIVVDKDRVIVVGDTRYIAAVEEGMTSIPILVASDLSPDQVRAYRIADNKVGEYSEWDDERLLKEITALGESGFDLSSLGFSEGELLVFTETITEQPDPSTIKNFAVPEPTAEKKEWILVHAPASACADLLLALKSVGVDGAHIEYSGATQ